MRSKGGKPVRQESGWLPTIWLRSFHEWVRDRSPARLTCSCRSRSPPAAGTADRPFAWASARVDSNRPPARWISRSGRRFRHCPFPTMRKSRGLSCLRVTASSFRSRRTSGTTATRRSTSRTRSWSSCAISLRTQTSRRAPFWPGIPTFATRRWPRVSAERARYSL